MSSVVRRVRLDDMPKLLEYMEEYHKTSNLSDVPIDRKSLVKVIEYHSQRRDTIALIAEHEDKIIGVLLGSLEPYFFNAKRFFATDLLFFSQGAGPQLWRKFRDWAFECGADRIMMGVSSGDERACQLLDVLGMESTGGMYVLRKERR